LLERISLTKKNYIIDRLFGVARVELLSTPRTPENKADLEERSSVHCNLPQQKIQIRAAGATIQTGITQPYPDDVTFTALRTTLNKQDARHAAAGGTKHEMEQTRRWSFGSNSIFFLFRERF
jgi:hypothetical protein